MQWNNGVWWWRHCLWCKKVKPVDTVDAVCSGIVVYGGVSAGYCILCIHWFDLFVPKTLSPPPYTTILLCTASTVSTASTGLTFLYQRQCPHHHIPLFHCVLRPLCTASIVYCIHCILHPLCPPCTVSIAYCIHTIESLLCNFYTT